MKIISFSILCLLLLANTSHTKAQTEAETLQWLRNHLNTFVVEDNDSILPYTQTITYTFLNEALLIKTVKDFYKDTSLNTPPAFSKIWYKDIFLENDTVIISKLQREQKEGRLYLYTIGAAHVYSIVGHDEVPLSYWRTFDEPMGQILYFFENKYLSMEALQKLYRLAAFYGAKQNSVPMSKRNSSED